MAAPLPGRRRSGNGERWCGGARRRPVGLGFALGEVAEEGKENQEHGEREEGEDVCTVALSFLGASSCVA